MLGSWGGGGGITPALYENTIVEVSAYTTVLRHKARQLDDLAETSQKTKGCNHTEEHSRGTKKTSVETTNERKTVQTKQEGNHHCMLFTFKWCLETGKNASLQQN